MPNDARKWVGSELTVLGMTLGICVILPVLVGRWLGLKWGNESAGVLLGLALGIAAAARELYRVVKRLNRNTPKTPTESAHGHRPDGES